MGSEMCIRDRYRKAAEQGIARAQLTLGIMFEKGQGVDQCDATALKWFLKAAEQGLADAQFNLGAMYANGQGVGQGDATAVKWYRKAAVQGHAKAHCGLAGMYARGLGGCPQDFAKALTLLRTAQAQGSEEASALIERVLRMQREQQAATITPTPPSPTIPIGARVELRGLQAKPKLNGRRGVVVKFVTNSSGRYHVQLDERGESFTLKAENLLIVIS